MSDYLQYRRKLKLEGKPPKERKQYRIPKVSKKQAEVNREYAKISKPMWEGQRCEMGTPVCTGRAQGMHHIWGKTTKKDRLDPKNMKRSCNACNGFAEAKHKEAEALGLKESRFKKR